MIDILLDFQKTVNFFAFIILTLILSVWIYGRLRKRRRISLSPFIFINAVLFIIWGLLTGVNHDTAEHFHCAWLVSQGKVPYIDFWQHHPPFLWLILAPLFKLLKPAFLIFSVSDGVT